eukprot:4219535-Pleurochrysis_carterae.AAC.1
MRPGLARRGKVQAHIYTRLCKLPHLHQAHILTISFSRPSIYHSDLEADELPFDPRAPCISCFCCRAPHFIARMHSFQICSCIACVHAERSRSAPQALDPLRLVGLRDAR